MKPEIMYDRGQCEGCGACIEACPNGAIKPDKEKGIITDSDKCTKCGKCEEECYFQARKLSSRAYTVEEVYESVMKDEAVYRRSGGGITISGGDPLIHKEFNYELLKRIKSAGISTAVETEGYVPWETVEKFIEVTDTFLHDLKLYSEEAHKKWTGVSNRLILENIKKLTDRHENVVIRIPLIKGVNDTEEEFEKMMEYVSGLRKVNSVHILPFHQLGSNKYELMGKEYEMSEWPDDNDEGVERCRRIAEGHGLRVCVGGTGFKSDRHVSNDNAVKLNNSFLYNE